MRESKHRLKITEQIIQEFQGRLAKSELKNRDLELILKEYNEKNDFKFRAVYDKLELTEGKIAQTNEKLKATNEELTKTKAKINSIVTHMTTTHDEPKSTDADPRTTFSQLEPKVMNSRQYSKDSDQAEMKHENVISNVTKATHLSDRKGIFDAGERKIIRSQTGEIYAFSVQEFYQPHN